MGKVEFGRRTTGVRRSVFQNRASRGEAEGKKVLLFCAIESSIGCVNATSRSTPAPAR
jgi:hypothetical protein